MSQNIESDRGMYIELAPAVHEHVGTENGEIHEYRCEPEPDTVFTRGTVRIQVRPARRR